CHGVVPRGKRPGGRVGGWSRRQRGRYDGTKKGRPEGSPLSFPRGRTRPTSPTTSAGLAEGRDQDVGVVVVGADGAADHTDGRDGTADLTTDAREDAGCGVELGERTTQADLGREV